MLEGFKKVDPDRWEFANEGFLRGRKDLLKIIKRRRPSTQSSMLQQYHSPYIEVGEFGLEGEIDRLKRDRQLLMTEVLKLRQEQQNTRTTLKAMEERLQATEQKQQHTMLFLARIIRYPNFLRQLVDRKEKMKEIEEAISKKRRRQIEGAPDFDDDAVGTVTAAQEFDLPDKMEPESMENVSSLDSLELEMEGLSSKRDDGEEHMAREEDNLEGDLNDEFWDELLSDGISDEKGRYNVVGVENKDVSLLADRLGFLGSSSTRPK